MNSLILEGCWFEKPSVIRHIHWIGPHKKRRKKCEMGWYENEGKRREWKEILSWIIKMCLTFSGFTKKTYSCDFLTLTNTAAMDSVYSSHPSFLYSTRDILDYLFTHSLIGEDRNLSMCGPVKVQRLSRGSFFWFIVTQTKVKYRKRTGQGRVGRVRFSA